MSSRSIVPLKVVLRLLSAQQEASDEVAALRCRFAVVEAAHAEAARARDLAQEAVRTLEQALTVTSIRAADPRSLRAFRALAGSVEVE